MTGLSTATYVNIAPDETLREAMLNEMVIRGHIAADVARTISTSESNVSRWLKGIVPDGANAKSAEIVTALISYLRLDGPDDYGILAFNSRKHPRLRLSVLATDRAEEELDVERFRRNRSS